MVGVIISGAIWETHCGSATNNPAAAGIITFSGKTSTSTKCPVLEDAGLSRPWRSTFLAIFRISPYRTRLGLDAEIISKLKPFGEHGDAAKDSGPLLP